MSSAQREDACCTFFKKNYRYYCDYFAEQIFNTIHQLVHTAKPTLFYFFKVLIQRICGICKGRQSTQPCSQLAVFEFPVAKLQHVCREAGALFPPHGWPRSDHTV